MPQSCSHRMQSVSCLCPAAIPTAQQRMSTVHTQGQRHYPAEDFPRTCLEALTQQSQPRFCFWCSHLGYVAAWQLTHLCKTSVPGAVVKITFYTALRRRKTKHFLCGYTAVPVAKAWASQHKHTNRCLQHSKCSTQVIWKCIFKKCKEEGKAYGIIFLMLLHRGSLCSAPFHRMI